MNKQERREVKRWLNHEGKNIIIVSLLVVIGCLVLVMTDDPTGRTSYPPEMIECDHGKATTC
jgi:hypothetical protein